MPNQARDIRLEGMTLETSGDNIGLLLRDCSNSKFNDLHIKSIDLELQAIKQHWYKMFNTVN